LWQAQFCFLVHLSTPAVTILDVGDAQVLMDSGRWIDSQVVIVHEKKQATIIDPAA
jgi:hypothetical protein